MNWLAHLHLSEPTPAFRLGNILPDFVPISALAHLPAEFQRGIQRHRQIDAFTDAHPIFRRSIRRIDPPFQRYGGVLIDIFYDHFLARDWESFASMPLRDFTAEFYASFDAHWADIPPGAHARFQIMRATDLLGTYREIDGIAEVLRGLSRRLRNPFDLAAVMPLFQRDYAALRDDFHEFFPLLRSHVSPAVESRP